ncbi:MAG: hypothetical protein ACQKBT_06935, partial [Puniceicoccales bacterium]
YLANESLWDDYFFSTIPEDGDFDPENVRLYPYSSASDTFSEWDQIGAGLMVDGAFNVNSTSLEAWKALLASFFGEDLAEDDESSSQFPRTFFSQGDAGGEEPSRVDDPDVYNGFRRLDETQISELAASIVTEVRRQGPFLSLSDFVNREPFRDPKVASDSDLIKRSGPLTRAIEGTSINDNLQSGAEVTVFQDGVDEKAVSGYRSEGLPGWFTQVDLLSRLGSILNARSDTFRIRFYGDFRDEINGEILSKAVGEAVVQRIPDFVDDSNIAYTPYDDDEAVSRSLAELTAINRTMGRRFVVSSFRWLDSFN